MRILLIISVFFVVQIRAQVELGLEYQRNVECIDLTGFDNLLLSNSSFLLTKSKSFYRLAYGLEIQEALMGQFGGFYVFGLTSDIDFSLNNSPLLLKILTVPKASTSSESELLWEPSCEVMNARTMTDPKAISRIG